MSEAVHYSLPSRFLTILRVNVTHGTTTTTYNNNNSNNYNNNYNHDNNNSIKGLIDAKAHTILGFILTVHMLSITSK